MKIIYPDKRKALDRQAPDVLLALCLYHEARGEPDNPKTAIPEDGLTAVAWVIKNRVRVKFKRCTTIPTVILKRKQFSCFNDWEKKSGRLYVIREPKKYDTAYEIGVQVIAGLIDDPTNGATHYCRHDCWPKWRAELEFIKRIGDHVFYK